MCSSDYLLESFLKPRATVRNHSNNPPWFSGYYVSHLLALKTRCFVARTICLLVPLVDNSHNKLRFVSLHKGNQMVFVMEKTYVQSDVGNEFVNFN